MDRHRNIVIWSRNWFEQVISVCFTAVNITTILYNVLFYKKATKQRIFPHWKFFIQKKYIYEQTLGTYLLINSSLHLSTCCPSIFMPDSEYEPFFGVLGFIIFYYLPRTTRKRQIGSFTFMIPFHCVTFVLTLFIFVIIPGPKTENTRQPTLKNISMWKME